MGTLTPEYVIIPSFQKHRIKLLLTAAALAVIFVVLIFIPALIPMGVFIIIFGLVLIDILFILCFTLKLYNIGIAFIVLVVAAIFFRNMRWPLTGALFTVGFSGLSIISVLYAWVFLRDYRHLSFLRYIGFFSGLILSIVAIGLLWKNMHWPYAGLFLSIGLGLFIPFLFAFVFTLPGSDFVSWNKTDRIFFFRAVLMPMTFVFILCVLMFVLPELWNHITRSNLIPFEMRDFDLFNKPGI